MMIQKKLKWSYHVKMQVLILSAIAVFSTYHTDLLTEITAALLYAVQSKHPSICQMHDSI